MSFICMRMKNDFHIKGWALNLVLIQGPGGTRKWPIVGLHVTSRRPCWWSRTKHLSPLTKLHVHVNYSWSNSVLLTTNMAALSRGCKPRISSPNSGRLTISIMMFTASKWFSNTRRVSVKRKYGQSIWYWGMIHRKSAFQKLHCTRCFCPCFFAWEISFVRSTNSSIFSFFFFCFFF